MCFLMLDDKHANVRQRSSLLACCFVSHCLLMTVHASSPSLFLLFSWHTVFLNSSFSLFLLSLQHVPSLPPSMSSPHHNPPPPDSALPFLCFPLGSGAKVGRQTEANASQGRAEGKSKAGELIMCVFVFWTVLPLSLFLCVSVRKFSCGHTHCK